jgi:flagellar biosynthesis protein FliR
MTEILISDFLIVLFIFLRIIGMIVAAPVLGHQSVPVVAKLFIAFVIAYMTFLTIDKSKIVLDITLATMFVNAAKEVVTGLIMGFALNFVFFGIAYAGHIIGFEMGLMAAEIMNPMSDISNNVVGEAIFYASMLLFILINGHHHIISAVVASFKAIPIAKYTVTQPLVDSLIKYAFVVFTIAFKIAAPIIVSFFLIHVAEGIIARVIPHIQIFYISQPLKIGLGLLFLSILAPLYVYVIKNLLNGYEYQLSEMINRMGV